MPAPQGFTYDTRKNGEVIISHGGRTVTTLRGKAAERFIKKVAVGDPQQLMARATGNYKRGNERG